MKMFVIVFTVFVSSPLFAVDNLFPCEGALSHTKMIDSNTRVELKDDEVLVRGTLYAYWETGMEDRTGWAVTDAEVAERIAPVLPLAFVFMQKGDRVYLFDDDGHVSHFGYYGEENHQPRLYKDAELTQLLGEPDLLRRAYGRQARADVIQTISEQRRNEWQAMLTPFMERYHQHLVFPGRFARIGQYTVEVMHFQRYLTGKLILNPVKRGSYLFTMEKGLESTRQDVPGLNVFLDYGGGKTIPLGYRDRLYLFDKDGKVFFQHQLKNGDFIEIKDQLEKADHAGVIHSLF